LIIFGQEHTRTYRKPYVKIRYSA